MRNEKISFDIEKSFMTAETDIVVGIDEAGRGCLVGPVVAACVWINQNEFPPNLLLQINDSKKIPEDKREVIFREMCLLPDNIFMFEWCDISAEVIDDINILQATLLAMKNAYHNLEKKIVCKPKMSLVDGNQSPNITPVETVIKGDAVSYSIAAASIVAKVMKDRLLNSIGLEFPYFNFDKNKGYGTKNHLMALEKFGPTKFHRKTYAPVKKFIK